MTISAGKNAFGLVLAAPLVSPFILIAIVMGGAGVPLLLRYGIFLVLGFGLVRCKRYSRVLQAAFGEAVLDKVRIGRLTVNILPAPKLTFRRRALLCLAFVMWLAVMMGALIIWFEARHAYLILLPLAAISFLFIINSLEKKWQI